MRFSAEYQPGRHFFEAIPEARRCVKMTRSGQRCRKVALNGCDVCGSHGGFWQRWRRQGVPYPASITAGRDMRRQAWQGLARYGRLDLASDWRWRASPAADRVAILAAVIVSQAENDPGIERRALEWAEGRLQWTSDELDRS